MKCAQYSTLQSEVEEILDRLTKLTTLQLESFRERDYEAFMKLDRELELVVGKKERFLGALRQHAKEHGCQPRLASAPDPKEIHAS